MKEGFGDIDLSDRGCFYHWSHDTIRWSDTDRAGHVNHLAIGAYVETGRSGFMSMVGDRIGTAQTFVTARLAIDFLRELHWPGVADVGTTVLHVGNSSCTLGHAVFSQANCVATAITVLVLIDTNSRQSTSISTAAREHLLQLSTSAVD